MFSLRTAVFVGAEDIDVAEDSLDALEGSGGEDRGQYVFLATKGKPESFAEDGGFRED